MLLQKDGWDLKLEDQEALRFPRDRMLQERGHKLLPRQN